MKKVVALFMSVLLLLTSVSIGVVATDKCEGIALKGSPTVDGTLGNEWAEAEQYTLSKRVVDGAAQTTGWFKIMWDNDAIYVGGQITDATNQNPGCEQLRFLFAFDGVPAGNSAVNFSDVSNAGAHSWNGEAYNSGGSKTPSTWDPGDAWHSGYAAGTAVIGNGTDDCAVSISYADGKYTFETKLYPTQALKSKLANNTKIGFDVRWNDFNNSLNDGAGNSKLTTIGWASSQVEWNADLREIGAITLLNEKPVVTEPLPNVTTQACYGTPVLDGSLSEWADAPANSLEKIYTGTKELGGWFKLMWDKEALYFAMQFEDPDPNSTLIKIMLNLDGVPIGDSPVTFADAPNAGAFAFNFEGYDFSGGNMSPINPGFTGNADGQAYAGTALFKSANVHPVITDTISIYEVKFSLTDTMKAKLAENATIGFDVMYIDQYGASESMNPTHMGWVSPYGINNFAADLRYAGKVTLMPVPEIKPQAPTAQVPEANTPSESNITSTSVGLKWNSVAAAASYEINVFEVEKQGNDTDYNYVRKISVAGSPLLVRDLTPDTEYAFQVLVYDSSSTQLAAYALVNAKTSSVNANPVEVGEYKGIKLYDLSGVDFSALNNTEFLDVMKTVTTPLTYQSSEGFSLPYRIYLPANYSPDKEYPLLVQMHGGGGRGKDNVTQISVDKGDMVALFRNQAIEEFIFITPQSPLRGLEMWSAGQTSSDDITWNYNLTKDNESPQLHAVMELVDSIRKTYSVDSKRLYTKGASAGGMAQLDILSRYSDVFAGSVIGCPISDHQTLSETQWVLEALAKTNIYYWHGDIDQRLNVNGSRALAEAMKAIGADKFLYTEYAGIGHEVLSDERIDQSFAWLFNQQRASEPSGFPSAESQPPTESDTPNESQSPTQSDISAELQSSTTDTDSAVQTGNGISFLWVLGAFVSFASVLVLWIYRKKRIQS